MTDTPEAVRLADQIHAGNGEWMQKAAALLRRIPGLEAEVQEQARLNGMGAERELALMAQVSRLEAELEKVRVPEGWKMVPVEPTPEMIHAVRFAGDPDSPAIGDPIIADVTAFPFVGGDVALRMCRAMLTAAPTPPNADQKGAA